MPSVRKKRFEEMTRAELEFTNSELTKQLALVTKAIEQKKDEIRLGGGLPKEIHYPDLASQRTNLKFMLGKIKKELASNRHHKVQRPTSDAEDFKETAKLLLEPGLYQYLLEETKARIER